MLAMILRNSLKPMAPLPSSSTSSSIAFRSYSSTFLPSFLISTWISCSSMDPLPSRSNLMNCRLRLSSSLGPNKIASSSDAAYWFLPFCFFRIMRNSSNSTSPFAFLSTSLIISCTFFSVSCSPRDVSSFRSSAAVVGVVIVKLLANKLTLFRREPKGIFSIAVILVLAFSLVAFVCFSVIVVIAFFTFSVFTHGLGLQVVAIWLLLFHIHQLCFIFFQREVAVSIASCLSRDVFMLLEHLGLFPRRLARLLVVIVVETRVLVVKLLKHCRQERVQVLPRMAAPEEPLDFQSCGHANIVQSAVVLNGLHGRA
uniref:Transmembrane protein n=1 Tax=Globisporangium ultimum (strain ATCC 200006 / CBS 805.95 / DAOM BR144) TaxID=431595 RepID=K3XC18_GLOUD